MKKVIIPSLCLFILTITVAYLISCNNSTRIIERNEEPLASKYVNFQEINEQYDSDIFEVRLFCQAEVIRSAAPNPIRIFSSVNNQLIVSCDAEKNDETLGDMLYFKLGNDGTIIDTLYIKENEYWPFFIDDFIFFSNDDEAYYTTWPKDGDTTKHAIKNLNKDLQWSNEQVIEKIERMKKDSKYWFLNNVYGEPYRLQQFYFYHDDQWQVIWQVAPENNFLSSEEEPYKYTNYVFRSGEEDPYLSNNITFLHFHPEEKIIYGHAIGGGNPGYNVTNWRGKAFFKATIADQDFEFFAPNIAVEKEKFDNFKNRFYTANDPGYSALIFTPSFYISPNGFAFYSADSRQIYLIKKK